MADNVDSLGGLPATFIQYDADDEVRPVGRSDKCSWKVACITEDVKEAPLPSSALLGSEKPLPKVPATVSVATAPAAESAWSRAGECSGHDPLGLWGPPECSGTFLSGCLHHA